MTGRVLLEAHGLGLAAGPKRLLERLSLRIEAGQFWVVVGANGVGKTTLLAALAGLVAAREGRVEWLGRDLAAWPGTEAARLRGFLPQHIDSLFGMSVLQAVLLGRFPHADRAMWDSDRDVAIALAALERVDLHGFADRDATSLSGGERQRTAIACLLAQEPLLYLLDEPLSHLDLGHQRSVMALLRDLVADGEHAAVASVHDLSMAARFATHALVIGGGTWVAGSADSVLDEATLSAAFGHPVRRLSDGETVALVAG